MNVNQVYDQATQGIQQQIPAVQQLYSQLIAGLQNQGQNQLQNTLVGAERAGVMRGTTADDTQAMLNQTLLQAQAPINLGQVKAVSGLQGQIGATNVARAGAVQQQQSLDQQGSLMAQQNQLDLQSLDRNAQVQEIQRQRAEARARASAAKASAGFDLSTVSADALSRALRLNMNSAKGKDGKVSPSVLAKAYNDWTKRAGLPAKSFWENFQGNWNAKQKNYESQFKYAVAQGV